MRLIFNTDKGRLQRDFGEFSPITIGETGRLMKGSMVPLELFLVGDRDSYTTPTASDYIFTLSRPGRPPESGILQVTWGSVSGDIEVGARNQAQRIEAALNEITEIDAAGGVDVEEIAAGLVYSITWREDGARALATAEITAAHFPGVAAVERIESGSATSREVQLLTIGETTISEITTTGWTANAEPALTVAVEVTGTANIREVESVAITGDLAAGSSFALGNSRQIPTDASGNRITSILNEELGADTISRVQPVGNLKWLIYWNSDGVQTTLAEGASNLKRQPGLTGTINLTSAKVKAAMENGVAINVLASLKNSTTGEILFSEVVTITDPGAKLESEYDTVISPILDTDGEIITDTDGNPI